MLTRTIFDIGKRYVSTCRSMPRRNIQNIEDAQVLECSMSLPEHQKKLQRRQPFLKNLFIGKFDTDFLTFPEPQPDDRYKKFVEWIKPIENYMTFINVQVSQVSRDKVFEKLKELDILRARIQKDYDGLNMSEVETLKILDTLAPMPWLTTSLIKNNIMPVDIISKYGNEVQKRKYLQKIGNGDLLSTICITEVNSGPNVRNIETTATLSKCGNFWILNVEKSHGGITCSDAISTIGQQEVHVCTVNFKDTHVPKENVLGEIGGGINILTDVFSPGNNRTAGEAIGILRHFLALLNQNILGRKHLDKNMHEFEAVEDIIARITCSLYSMESVAYFTSTIDDLYDNQDLELERAVMETYCANECVQQIYKGLQVIGVDSYLNDNPYMHLYKDALALSIYDGSVIDEKIYIALLGLQYTGKNFHEHVHKARNYDIGGYT
ncbi:hypothetical protein KPH14_007142 [Odynerus spinipes]|uniref:Uncharacterized protein n=1 Tax=Odynerus spinipes TaxID=1348599 RepID=A0AAD9RSJ2_9HYME|nr:hypothetical protein KPH14_007142 [Odynerus spinipes]